MADRLRTIEAVQAQELFDLIQEAIAPLAENEITVSPFTIGDVAELGIQLASLLKDVRILRSFCEQKIILSLLRFGQANHGLNERSSLGVVDLIKFCKFLRTDACNVKVKELQTKARLLKRGKGILSPQDTAYVALFDAANADFSRLTSEIREKYDAEIIELRKAILAKEKACRNELQGAKNEYYGLGLMEGPTTGEVSQMAFDKYNQYCAMNNVPLPPKTDATLCTAVRLFESDLRTEIKAATCRRAELREFLDAYCEKKIKFFRTDYQDKSADTFTGYYAAATGKVPNEEPIREEERADAQHPHRQGLRERESDPGEEAIGGLLGATVNRQGDPWQAASTYAGPEAGDGGPDSTAAQRKRKGKQPLQDRPRRSSRAKNVAK